MTASEALQATANNLLKTSFWNYSEQLEEFISRYKTRPPDIKFWPYGPYWPKYYDTEILETPRHCSTCPPFEPILRGNIDTQFPKTFDNQETQFTQKWRGVLIVYDSERSSRDRSPQPVPEGCCPNLVFESRFESGNLRQARRVGQFEYELVLKTDLYTNRHTQWYYFRVSNAVPGVTYKFRIVNLLKRDSLYNYGMRPLLYSEKEAKEKSVGWSRAGHHISYSRNVMHLHCPLLMKGIPYYELEWQMDFPHTEDTYYLAHCYPYTFTDLKEDLDSMLNHPDKRQYIRREVLCETRAGNSCFLVTVSNFDTSKEEQHQKKVVVVTARVHPGESQASWMMKGLIEFVVGQDPVASELRNRFIFKIVPMLNPDGVIVGNYRCSLAARDLNRNYRHPRKESFPTVWFTKSMMEKILERHDIILYCDLHGHSRKHNVFMYGNNTSETEAETNGVGAAQAFLNERLFPWLMSQKSPDKFSFPSCKFQIKRCKEATGRVVMWRQMRILNSFTLEATFSGTIIDKKELRHFNINDFMDMGKVLCETVLEYQIAQENKARQTEIVLELTRYLTSQVLDQRKMMGNKVPNFKALTAKDKTEGQEDDDAIQNDMLNEDLDDSLLQYLDKPYEASKREKKLKKSEGKSGNLSRQEVDTMLDNASLKTMDGCWKILTQLNVRESLMESDSSDSDSESEPEMKYPEPKSKKKKRKSKKQRDREFQDRKNGSGNAKDKHDGERAKSLTNIQRDRSYKNSSPIIVNGSNNQALPTISSTSDAPPDGMTNSNNNKKGRRKSVQYKFNTISSAMKFRYFSPTLSERKTVKMSPIKKQDIDEENTYRDSLLLGRTRIRFNDQAVGGKQKQKVLTVKSDSKKSLNKPRILPAH
ncbi:hypothetical protein FSP39_000988 [Pinctada imbricata]|uniref:Peptidase M14 domain-containing protein n=1 Tax=Pinctada imbricata TaxID=66713 RepID=A0AA88XKF0_PINIB|nr:hypothetical protein FSP39_000988 [Pinctada imbricata]